MDSSISRLSLSNFQPLSICFCPRYIAKRSAIVQEVARSEVTITYLIDNSVFFVISSSSATIVAVTLIPTSFFSGSSSLRGLPTLQFFHCSSWDMDSIRQSLRFFCTLSAAAFASSMFVQFLVREESSFMAFSASFFASRSYLFLFFSRSAGFSTNSVLTSQEPILRFGHHCPRSLFVFSDP